jgi:hypothetical protein
VIIFVTTAHPQALKHRGPGFGRLVVPDHFPRIADTAHAGIPWAADNGCFQTLNAHRFRQLLAAAEGLPGCRFVATPDVVGDASATARRFEQWAPALERRGLPVALVAQDGLERMTGWLERTWDRLAGLFLGGTTDWKLSTEAAHLAAEAKARGKWVHMGRVNSRRRLNYARLIGCDSIDGTQFSMFRDRWLPVALNEWLSDEIESFQQRLPV